MKYWKHHKEFGNVFFIFSIPLVYNANEQERIIRIIQETITVQYNIFIILEKKNEKDEKLEKTIG